MYATILFRPAITAIAAGIIGLLIPASYAYDITPTQPLNSTAYTDTVDDVDLTMDSSDDTVIAAWMDHGTANGLILISRSTDGGLTWSPVVTLAGGSNRLQITYVGNDNWTIFDGANNEVFRSADDGVSWSGPTNIISSEDFGPVYFIRAASNNMGLLLKLYNGTTLLRSTDGGATWENQSSLPEQEFSEIVHSGGSNWVAVSRPSGEFFVSGDDGANWVSVGVPFSLTQEIRGPYIATDHDGKLIVTMTEAVTTNTAVIFKVYVSESSDHGVTWSPIKLAHENTLASYANAYPQASTSPFMLHVADDHWKLLSFDILYFSFFYGDSEMSIASSYDGGISWTASEEIVPDVGNWIGTYSYGGGFLNNVFEVSQGNIIAGWELRDLAGSDVDIAYRVISDPVEPPPPSGDPAPNFTGLWAPADSKCKTNKKGATKCNLKATFLVCNTGSEKAQEKSTIRFYLSQDNQLDVSDVELKSQKVKKLKPGKQKTAKVKLKKLASPVTGQYLIAVLDADQSVVELDEADNIIVSDPLP